MTASKSTSLRLWGNVLNRHIKNIALYIILFCIFANLIIYLSLNTGNSNVPVIAKPVERKQIIVPDVLRSGRPNPLKTPPSWMDDWIAHKKFDTELIGDLSKYITMDLIYTWVNGSEPELHEMKEHYKSLSPLFQVLKNLTKGISESNVEGPFNKNKDQSKNRFRDMNELQYSARSVAYYGVPGLFRKVHILATEVIDRISGKKHGQIPRWLDQEKAKGMVEVVPHSEVYDNKEHLPSFSSLSIESQMHHIPGLADIFVYLNDDVFFGKPINTADFWTPLYGFVFHMDARSRIAPKVPTLEVRRATVGESESLHYTSALLAKQFGARDRVYLAHIPHILSVPIMEEMQALWPEEFNKTSSHRFRGEGYGQDIQVSFLLAHYVMERLRETQLTSFWKYRLDKNQDGKLDWEERQHLIRMLDHFEEVKKANAKIMPHLRNKPFSSIEAHDKILPSVGIPWTQETKYLFSGIDEYPFMLHFADLRRTSQNQYSKTYSPQENPAVRTCRFYIDFCLGPEFMNSSIPDFDGSTGKGSVFERMAFTEFHCGDCLLHIIHGESASPGLSGIMPPDKDSEKYRQVLTDLAKYNYVVGGSEYSFLQLKDGLQAQKALDTLMQEQKKRTFFCINDDVQDSPLIEKRVKSIFSGFLKKRFPIPSLWENLDTEPEPEPEAETESLPQPEDNFARRFRNRAPLVIRQIVSQKVIKRWTSDPAHITRALNQSVQETEQEEEQLPHYQRTQDELNGTTNPALRACTQLKEPLLPVMIAEDTKNFMDNPQFTKKITMTANEIVARVLVPESSTELASVDAVIPNLQIKEAQTSIKEMSNCPLCESQSKEQDNFNRNGLRRFYYRGTVPSTLYSDLPIPDLLTSLSLPKESTPFASAPNKDLMRTWISLAGATTPLHYDRCHGVLIQLVGRKRFVIFSHEDTNSLYPYDGITGPGHASKVRGLGHCFPFAGTSSIKEDYHLKENMAEVLQRWPKVKNADPWVIDLEPGDALYTPPGFWHEVTSVDNSISITVAWDMDASELEHVPRHMAF
ncbi:Xanthine phosphoribosyltransferase 1 [Mortierella sp. AM989]|nr:Xanthine phosphoribosyltransferase 1 [Mortierella sp. AM989]